MNEKPTAINLCRGCGAPSDPTTPQPEHCQSCPPTRCEDCGGQCDWATEDLCACWTYIADLSLADVKALFARDDLSVDPVRGDS